VEPRRRSQASQGESGGARECQEEPGRARRSQDERARRSQDKRARKSQEEPGGVRRTRRIQDTNSTPQPQLYRGVGGVYIYIYIWSTGLRVCGPPPMVWSTSLVLHLAGVGAKAWATARAKARTKARFKARGPTPEPRLIYMTMHRPI
jgi:hypothetical protein